ncbi:MAG TPA: gephyrin-like molybdotransferase Glp [Acidobacteriaceae bacterium]|nr:gephyrin-like molybdotransferase Glp [Acidobacteriaceae bacterium]
MTTIIAMALLSYAEAAEQIQLYLKTQSTREPDLAELGAAREAAAQRSRREKVALSSAAGRVLAEPIYADRDLPPFPRSTRDGYACRSDEANTHQLLYIAGELRAGQLATLRLSTGEACEIMTGAPVPEGADAVFMIEHAEHGSHADPDPEGDFVRLAEDRALAAGENIVPRGSEAKAGAMLLSAGVRLGPAQIALAAQCGYARLAVESKPLVAILTTGDEIVPVDVTPGPSQIRNSNAPMLTALVKAAGCDALPAASAADTLEALDAALDRTLVAADLLLVSGGISAGRFDLVAEALTRRGARFFFGGVAIQPGKPVAFGQVPASRNPAARQVPFLALPGNPISSAVTFRLFAAPLLAALACEGAAQPRFSLARLKEPWRGKPGLTRFLPAWCDFAPETTVRLVAWQGSGDLAAFARSNCLLIIAPETTELPAGALVQIMLN